jgi:transcriptional regulator with XRE-family HTH domain
MADNFGKRLYSEMVERGLHQSAIAQLAGLPRDTISDLVRARRPPTEDELSRLAKALEVNVSDLAAGV